MTELLSIEAYAAIVAHFRYFKGVAREDILRALGEGEERFADSEDLWRATLIADADQNQPTDNVVRYGTAYGESLERLRRARPRLEALTSGPSIEHDPRPEENFLASPHATRLAPGEMSVAQVSAIAASAQREVQLAGDSENHNWDTTLEQPLPNPNPVLPFGAVRSPEFLAQAVDRSGVRSPMERGTGIEAGEVPIDGSTGTQELDVRMIRAQVIPFGAAAPARDSASHTAEVVVRTSPGITQDSSAPVLTLEQYATLRARLSLVGENDVATWKEFGLLSGSAKAAVQAGFAERFRRDADSQRLFVELVQRATTALKSEGLPSSGLVHGDASADEVGQSSKPPGTPSMG